MMFVRKDVLSSGEKFSHSKRVNSVLLRGSCVALQFTACVPSSRRRWLRLCCVRRLGLRTSWLEIGSGIEMAAAEEWEDVLEEEREEEAESKQDDAAVEQEAASDLRCRLRHLVARVRRR